MVRISPGTFTMGSPRSEQRRHKNEGPLTEVTISQEFWMSKFMVTLEDYASQMGYNPSWFNGDQTGNECLHVLPGEDFGVALDRPVEQVSWEDAMTYCRKLGEDRKNEPLPDDYEYRLPTEAEWEYACRSGTTTQYSSGHDEDRLGDYEWFGGNHRGKTQPVGTKKPNPWGIHDMHGNLCEWCYDWVGTGGWIAYLKAYFVGRVLPLSRVYTDRYPGGRVTDPIGPSEGKYRVVRGGSFVHSATNCRAAIRRRAEPSYREFIGFRVVPAPTIDSLRAKKR